MQGTTYPNQEGSVKALVDLEAVSTTIERCYSAYASNNAPSGLPVPIVMVAGGLIGLCGIVTSLDWKEQTDALQLPDYTVARL